jgi:hypothetical protein
METRLSYFLCHLIYNILTNLKPMPLCSPGCESDANMYMNILHLLGYYTM